MAETGNAAALDSLQQLMDTLRDGGGEVEMKVLSGKEAQKASIYADFGQRLMQAMPTSKGTSKPR